MFKIKKIRPMFTGVVTTANRYSGDQVETGTGIVLPNKMRGTLNQFQTVIAAGAQAAGVKEGDVVRLNFSRYLVPRHVPGKLEDNVRTDSLSAGYEIPAMDIDGRECLMVQYNDIDFVVEDYDVSDGGLLE